MLLQSSSQRCLASLNMGSEARIHMTPWLLLRDSDEVQWKPSQSDLLRLRKAECRGCMTSI